MKKLLGLCAFALTFSMVACGSTGGGGGGDNGGGCNGGGCNGGGCNGGGSSKMDGSQSTIDMYVNGTMKAPHTVMVHADPKAGQYWEHSMDTAGTKMTMRWQVAKVDGTTAVIEYQSKMDSQYMVSDYVVAYQVDLSVKMGDAANVTKAWVAKPGEAGKEIQITPFEKVAGGTEGEKPKEEAFTDLEMAGKKFSGKIYIMTVAGTESKSWMADNGYFGGLLKTESGGTVGMSLSACGEDATALLKW
ncbi:MAG: hypothetical protein IT463_02835 [Planctomycetes bacterium]|nr:hypothetical protein [Planctomycetota bacterium]